MRQNRSTKKSKRLRAGLKIGTAIVFGAGLFMTGWLTRYWIFTPSTPFNFPNYLGGNLTRTIGLKTSLVTERVDVFGGSIAHGWVDPHNDSYLRRAFSLRSESTNTNYDYIDHTIVGETPVLLQKSGQYQTWLATDRPQIVVLSWGLLNSMDSKHKITATQFGAAVHTEIAKALAAHAVVFIVTPPVVQASATTLHARQETFIGELFTVVSNFKNKNIVIFDVYHQMEAYMAAHGQTYLAYYNGNSWHPDAAGHELAGMLLFNDLVEKYGLGSVRFQPAVSL